MVDVGVPADVGRCYALGSGRMVFSVDSRALPTPRRTAASTRPRSALLVDVGVPAGVGRRRALGSGPRLAPNAARDRGVHRMLIGRYATDDLVAIRDRGLKPPG